MSIKLFYKQTQANSMNLLKVNDALLIGTDTCKQEYFYQRTYTNLYFAIYIHCLSEVQNIKVIRRLSQ